MPEPARKRRRLIARYFPRRRCRAVNTVNENHRITFVRRAFAARGDASAAADTALRVYEHCFLHNFPLETSINF